MSLHVYMVYKMFEKCLSYAILTFRLNSIFCGIYNVGPITLALGSVPVPSGNIQILRGRLARNIIPTLPQKYKSARIIITLTINVNFFCTNSILGPNQTIVSQQGHWENVMSTRMPYKIFKVNFYNTETQLQIIYLKTNITEKSKRTLRKCKKVICDLLL